MKLERYEKYKDSGIEWIGEIPEHWEVRKLKYVTKFDNGFPFNSQKFDQNGGVIVVRIGDIKDTINFNKCIKSNEIKIHSNALISKHDTLIALSGATTGKSCFIKEDVDNVYINQRISKFNYVNSFLYYVISNEKFKKFIFLGADGSAQENVSNSKIINMFVPFPNNTEQAKIADFLDKKTAQIDKAITLKEQLIERLKERRQILINDAVTKGLDKTVKMKNSGIEWIGEIPAHWEVRKNKILFSERNEPGNKYLPILMVSIHSAVSSEEVSESENIRGKIRIEDKSNYKHVKPTDIVYNMMRAWQGAIGSVRVEGMVSPAYTVAKNKGIVNSEYFEYLYRTDGFIQQMDSYSKGITDFRKRLYWDEFKQLYTIIPPEREQQEIVAYIKSINNSVDNLIELQQKQIEKLKEYRASLIDSVVTGKVRVVG